MNKRSFSIDWREWPTVLLLLSVYFAWGLVTYFHREIGSLATIIVATVTITLYASLVHEALHGHPTSNAFINELLVLPALSLIFPYRRFKDLHIAHHNDDILTDPFDDPETYYVTEAEWLRFSGFRRGVLTFMNTLFGRFLLGPIHTVVFLLKRDVPLLLKGAEGIRVAYLLHGLGVAITLYWVLSVAGMSLWYYLLLAYLGSSLLMLRTFAEHQSHALGGGRTVIIEGHWFFSLLFLNNNLHIVHHRNPDLAWYDLPALYRARQNAYREENEGYVFSGYWPIIRQYLFHAKEPVMHPINRRLAEG
jgi:fatty acid desaturase